MQITNSVVCDTSSNSLYKQIKPTLSDEHVFPLTGFFLRVGSITFGGSVGILSTARPELPYRCSSQTKFQDETSRRMKECDINRYISKLDHPWWMSMLFY